MGVQQRFGEPIAANPSGSHGAQCQARRVGLAVANILLRSAPQAVTTWSTPASEAMGRTFRSEFPALRHAHGYVILWGGSPDGSGVPAASLPLGPDRRAGGAGGAAAAIRPIS